MTTDILHMLLDVLFDRMPAISDFFSASGLPLPEAGMTVVSYFSDIEARGISGRTRMNQFLLFVEQLGAISETAGAVSSLTVQAGRTKTGEPEEMNLHMDTGDVVSIVGPTGSGKSRLLEDIECLACRDTPSFRQVLINGAPALSGSGWKSGFRLVAQVSQNMNFVMDLGVRDFLLLHAESRMAGNPEDAAAEVYDAALSLSGEPFSQNASLTSLSGGQSRALMVADTACLSRSPVVVIDELENAGIDKERALALLSGKGKIILIATHDPFLALLADRRVVIRNGAMVRELVKTDGEESILAELKQRDRDFINVQNRLRTGERIFSVSG